MIKIINNKKVEMTGAEWEMYEKICKSYTDQFNKGEDLFIDLFETNDDGIIVFLKPPSKRRTSLEVFLFLVALQTHQHLRLMHNEFADLADQVKKKMQEIDEKLNKITEKKE